MQDSAPAESHAWIAWTGVVAYIAIGVLYWPSVHLAPLPLDDRSALEALTSAPFSQIWQRDHFGHVRPLKSALFWLLSRHPAWLMLGRAGLLALVLVSGWAVQRLCTPLLRSQGWALCCALCCLLNPITLHVLCWLSTANLTLCLLAVLSYLLLAERPVLALAGLVVALLSHELALLAPLLALAYQRSLGRASTQTRWLVAASFACCLGWLAWYAVAGGSSVEYRFAAHPRWQLWWSAPRYMLNNLRLWCWLPGRFGVLLSDEPSEHLLTSALAWLGLIGACVCWWRWRRPAPVQCFALLWVGVWLAPLTSFVPFGNTPVAMHYLYLPGVGLALLGTHALQQLAAALRRRGLLRSARLPVLLLGALIAAWLSMSPPELAFAAWGDAAQLYSMTIKNYPRNIEARVNLTASYLDAKRYAEADALLTASLRLAPLELGLLSNRFKLLAETGHMDEALQLQLDMLGRAFADAQLPEARFSAGYQLATALVRAQRYAEARALLERLLTEFPGRPELLFGKQLLAEPGQGY